MTSKLPFESFKFISLLNSDERTKSVAILAKPKLFADSAKADDSLNDSSSAVAVILAEKTGFGEVEDVKNFVESQSSFDVLAANDIYYRLMAKSTDGIKFTVIYPATPAHIAKYSRQSKALVRETPSIYDQVTRGYIESLDPSRHSWVHNILSGESESDKIILNTKYFVVLPDSKWDETSINGLYVLVLLRDANIRSLRDVNREHVEVFEATITNVTETLCAKFKDLSPDRLRFFVHYQPTYYHFHVHVTLSELDCGHGFSVGQAHLLQDIIENLKLDAEYYRKRTLFYYIGNEHELFKRIQKHNS